MWSGLPFPLVFSCPPCKAASFRLQPKSSRGGCDPTTPEECLPCPPSPKHPSSLLPRPLLDADFMPQSPRALVQLGLCDVFVILFFSPRIQLYLPMKFLPLITLFLKVKGINCVNSHSLHNVLSTGCF